jgi:hypothetical protein
VRRGSTQTGACREENRCQAQYRPVLIARRWTGMKNGRAAYLARPCSGIIGPGYYESPSASEKVAR